MTAAANTEAKPEAQIITGLFPDAATIVEQTDASVEIDISGVPADLMEALTPATDAARAMRDAALAEAANAPSRRAPKPSETMLISPFLIDVEPGFNFRDFRMAENKAAVVKLGHSIAQGGVKVALVGAFNPATGRFVVRDGETRLRGVMYAINVLGVIGPQTEAISVRVPPRGLNDFETRASQFDYNMGRGFNMLEHANGVAALVNMVQGDEARVAKRLGLTVAQVKARLSLAELPEAVKFRIIEGKIKATEAVALAKDVAGDGAKAVELIDRAVEISTERGGKKAGTATASTLAEAASEQGVRRRGHRGNGRDQAEPRGPNVKTIVREILGRASINNPGRNARVNAEFSAKDWKALAAAVGFVEAAEEE